MAIRQEHSDDESSYDGSPYENDGAEYVPSSHFKTEDDMHAGTGEEV